MSKLRIVFMGTPDFAVGILNELVINNYNVVGAITAPDKPSGRGLKMHASAVKKFCIEHNIPVLQPKNLKNETFINELKQLKADLQIVVAFRMLPKEVWQLPPLGTFNLHASLLPDYRGAAPINWAIINGETTTGVTTFFIDEKIDTGAVILQQEVAITPHETAGELHDKLMQTGSELVLKTVNYIEQGKVVTKEQPRVSTKSAPKLFKEDCKIDWSASIENIYNKIRGLSPYPGAWTNLINGDQTIEIKIYKASIEKEKYQYAPGSILADKKELKIVLPDGMLKIDELQLPGKKKMQSQALLNGYRFEDQAKVL